VVPPYNMEMMNKNKKATKATVTGVERLPGGWFVLKFSEPEMAAAAAPGQFVQVRSWVGSDPLLRRPLGIAGTTDAGEIILVVKIVGQGTKLLSLCKPGDEIEAIGPLGIGFPAAAWEESVAMIAGGTGLAPFLFLSQECNRANLSFFYGARTADECKILDVPRFSCSCGMEYFCATTEDGTVGAKGLVTEALEQRLRGGSGRPDRIFTCGPTPMMKRVHEIAIENSIPCHVSLEAMMGCGFGACMGCVVPGTKKQYVHVCAEGPVFDSREIDWEKIL
jgi:dihydroorotate dehydrogenase electron transfer subunit